MIVSFFFFNIILHSPEGVLIMNINYDTLTLFEAGTSSELLRLVLVLRLVLILLGLMLFEFSILLTSI